MSIVVNSDITVWSIDCQTVLENLFGISQPTAHDSMTLLQFCAEGCLVGCWIIGTWVGSDSRERLLLTTHIEYALTLLFLAYSDCYPIIARRKHNLLVSLPFILPHLVIIYGISIEKTDNPVASLYVAPTAVEKCCLLLVGRIGDVPYFKEVACVAFNKVKLLDVLRQWLEVECHVGFAGFRNRDVSVKCKVCLTFACLLCADDWVRLSVFSLQHGTFPKRESGIRTVPNGDV